MLVLKAISNRKETTFSCDGPHKDAVPATWEVELSFIGTLRLCTSHYREYTAWECGNERKCNRVNYGLTGRCVCGWTRPDICRKCGQTSIVPLIKIVEKREPHPCHECIGGGKAQELVQCGSCNGNTRIAEKDCVTCFGTGKMTSGDTCSACDGIGTSWRICRTCKGAGETFTWADKICPSCNGSGTCNASSANWGIDRIPLADISEGHRDKLKDHIGQYLCFRCANPDFQFSPYRHSEGDLQCLHYENKPDGDIVRCTQMISRNNPDKNFCFAHTEPYLCGAAGCGKKLKLDEWGGRCRDHAKCARCEEKPLVDSLFCAAHIEYKSLGRMLEKERLPETPPQILGAQERVQRSLTALERRCDSSRERSRRHTEKIRELERLEYEIVALDSPENKEKNNEVLILKAEVASLESQEKKEESEELKLRITDLELQIDKGRKPKDRIDLLKIQKQIEKLDKWIEDDLAVYIRNRHISKELFELLERLKELRHYELWDPKSTPVYVGKPEMVLCKSCKVQFNARLTKWLCPYCTTVTPVEVGDVSRGKRSDSKMAYIHYPTDNSLGLEHEKILVCELCCKRVSKVKPARLLVPLRYIRGDSSCVPNAVYFACEPCVFSYKTYNSRENNERRKKVEDDLNRKELLYIQCAGVREKFYEDLKRRRREDYIATFGRAPVDFNFKFSPKKSNTANLISIPVPFPIPVSKSAEETKKEREAAKKKDQERMADEGLKRFEILRVKDDFTAEERSELSLLASLLIGAGKKFKEFSHKIGLSKSVPPPPPSRWGR